MPSRNHRALSARHVRHLHVRAGADEDASRATTLLADALRTASLPGADDGRLVVIRRLALGRIPAGVGAPTLALQIERVTSAILSQAVVYDDRPADTANAVTFPSRGAALIALARRHGRGARTNEWFWPMVVRGWRSASRSERWLLLNDAAHELPEALLVAAAVLEQAVRAGVEDELLSAIPRGRGDLWLGHERWSGRVEESWALPPFRRRHLECLERWQHLWGPTDDRVLWLGTIVAVQEHPTVVASPHLRALVAHALEHIDSSGPPSRDWRDVSSSSHRPIDSPVVDATDRTQAFDLAHAPDTVPLVPRAEIDSDGIDSAEWPIGAPTSHAGLFFIVPILEHLGFSKYVSSRPQLLATSFPSQLLSFIGQRVGLTADDPIAASLAWVDADVPAAPNFAIGDLPDRTREVLLTPPPRVVLDSLFIAWLTAVRRWCRREARTGLTTLVCRPGRVFNSRTHTDVCFALSHVDLRLRRLALDTDPGWVPWLGRSVSFHYVQGDERTR